MSSRTRKNVSPVRATLCIIVVSPTSGLCIYILDRSFDFGCLFGLRLDLESSDARAFGGAGALSEILRGRQQSESGGEHSRTLGQCHERFGYQLHHYRAAKVAQHQAGGDLAALRPCVLMRLRRQPEILPNLRPMPSTKRAPDVLRR